MQTITSLLSLNCCLASWCARNLTSRSCDSLNMHIHICTNTPLECRQARTRLRSLANRHLGARGSWRAEVRDISNSDDQKHMGWCWRAVDLEIVGSVCVCVCCRWCENRGICICCSCVEVCCSMLQCVAVDVEIVESMCVCVSVSISVCCSFCCSLCCSVCCSACYRVWCSVCADLGLRVYVCVCNQWHTGNINLNRHTSIHNCAHYVHTSASTNSARIFSIYREIYPDTHTNGCIQIHTHIYALIHKDHKTCRAWSRFARKYV